MALLSRFRSVFSFTNIRRIFQFGGPREIDLGAHTIKSHGASVARNHMLDWLILVVLGVITIILNQIHPFNRFVGKDMMDDLRYPMKDNTVPVWAIPIYAVLLPILIFVIVYLRRRDVYDLHHSILGLLFAVVITGVLTEAIKNAVGRPRPDFFWRCFPDGIDAYDRWGDVICHGKASDIKEGHKSFPSGHTSWSFAGLGFLSLYLSGKIQVFDRNGHVAKLCITFFPLLFASLVGISRVDDYWHHWQDVFAGGLLGLVVATFCYCQFFPLPYHNEGWGPYAYFRALEETRSNAINMNDVSSAVNGQSTGYVRRESNAEMRSNGETFMAEKMPDIQLGAHTIRSHGAKVLRSYMHDWLILFLLAALDLGLNLIEPFHRFVGEDMMTDLKYPLQDNTVPFWGVPVYNCCFVATYCDHSLLFSVFITAVLTDAIKDGVGRPRPDFFWRCFPNGKGVFDPVTKNVMCTGDKAIIKEGHKSFPRSFAGLGFLALYLSGKIRVFDRKGHVAKLCIVFLPLLVASLVAVSRVDDYWHHWQDVFAGSIIGLAVSSFCWGPFAYFQMLAESQNIDPSTSNTENALTIRQPQLESICIQPQPQHNMDGFEHGNRRN
ncbi:hypothetical protein F8388_021699 [Cannabis sativa]|uniref:Phosphatidic acid phosphatase type 2/haloperoxidase domain-containing protein n=1 Tax=Cannabis sativa TaxID=3483 RepID=A0A7J6DXY3_CANSA|nr:hypothetical protein F8388_021699 [Cannabis sativa]